MCGSWQDEHWLVAGAIGTYVAGVTWFARTEARRSSRLQLAAATLVILGGIGLLGLLPSRVDEVVDLLERGPARWTVLMAFLAAVIARLVGEGRDRWDGVDWVVPHQASLPGIWRLARRLRIPRRKMNETVRSHGNVIAASIPLALHEAIVSGRLQRGQTVFLLGTSAGFSLGGALLRY